MNLDYVLAKIDPRGNKDEVLRVVGRFLDNCDPDDRPVIRCSVGRSDEQELRAWRNQAGVTAEELFSPANSWPAVSPRSSAAGPSA